MIMNFVKIINALFPTCMQECEAKNILRTQFEHFDDEQKIETAHRVCHQVGYYDLIVKVLLALFIFQTIYFILFFRLH